MKKKLATSKLQVVEVKLEPSIGVPGSESATGTFKLTLSHGTVSTPRWYRIDYSDQIIHYILNSS